jgi:hypothetical protein
MNEVVTREESPKCIAASELRKLPEAEQDAILEAHVALAEVIYRTDRELTDFEAFGEDDFDGDSLSAKAG